MNKKLIASGIALALCLSAAAPVYNSLYLNREISGASGQQQVEAQVNKSLLTGSDISLAFNNSERAEAIEAANNEAAKAEKNRKASIIEVKNQSDKSPSESTNMQKVTASVKKTAPATPAKTTASKTSAVKASTPKSNTTTATTTAKKSVSRGTTSTTAVKTSAQTTTSKASAIISTAKSYIGVPYVWGGTTPNGFDCSGFTQYVLKKHGVSIPRVTSEQYSAGTAVSKSNLRVGDLVFFTTYKPGPSHVGFYIGSGKFIHASSSKGVTISDLSNSYFSGRYIGARRVL